MRVVTFFIYLCFLLLRADAPVYAGTQHGNTRYAQPVKFTGTDYYKVICDTGSDDSFIGDDAEDEDEDVNILFAAKYKLPARYNTAGSYHSILSYLYNYCKAPPFFGGPVAHKYIVQRTLKI